LYILYGFSTEDVSRMKKNALWNVLKHQSGGTYIKRERGGVGGRNKARKKTMRDIHTDQKVEGNACT